MAPVEQFDCPLQCCSSFSAHRFCLVLSNLPSWGQATSKSFVLLQYIALDIGHQQLPLVSEPPVTDVTRWEAAVWASPCHAGSTLCSGSWRSAQQPPLNLLAEPELMSPHSAVPWAVPAFAELPQVSPCWVLWRFALISPPAVHFLLFLGVYLMFAVIFEHPTVLQLVKQLFCLGDHPTLGNGRISLWMCKKLQEQRTHFLQLLKTTRQTQQQILLSESDCWLENLPKPMQALSKRALLSAVWHTCLGIPFFYDAYHTMSKVGLESDGKDEHHLESWEYVSVLQGMAFCSLPYAVCHASQ